MSPTVTLTYTSLMFAIVLEVIGTTFLQKSEQFTRLWPSIIVLISYFSAFYFLSISLRTIPVGIAYGIWSGVGIVLISCIGYFIFKQKLDLAAMIGLGLIIAGVIVVNIFSKTIMH